MVVASTLAVPSLAQANLLTNPGFETGNFSGWTRGLAPPPSFSACRWCKGAPLAAASTHPP